MTDWRLPEHRRGVFLDFYSFHLRYGAHPGIVYMLMPYLRDRYGWDEEDSLWFAFLNGNTQNPVTSLLLMNAGTIARAEQVIRFWETNYERLAFDTDRRYHKKALDAAIDSYLALVRHAGSQRNLWYGAAGGGFKEIWKLATSIHTFGRLSAFSYAEYLRIMGVPFDCDNLFLDDMAGSRSHRNGLCIVLGLDHLDWHSSNPDFQGHYTRDALDGLELEAAALLRDARKREAGTAWQHDVSLFTLESTLCTYKGWHRVNRRYPGVYLDMLHDRIKAAENQWPRENLEVFWEARASLLPEYLRLEDVPCDPGLDPIKQNWYRETGEVIVMGNEPDLRKYWSVYDDAVTHCGFGKR